MASRFDKEIKEIINKMTFDEKVSRMTTTFKELKRLNIPRFYCGGEAAHGLQERNDQSFDKGTPNFTTIFQNPIGMSASWDRELMKEAGHIVGMEGRALLNENGTGKMCVWAPTVDPERDSRWGRNEEGYGEDPHLIGQMAGSFINGLAGEGEYLLMGSTLKHFYANNNEEGRTHTSSDMSDKDKWEYYLETFRQVLKYSKACGIMASYNAVNNIPSVVNSEMKDVLKDCYNLEHVVTDGGGFLPIKNEHLYTKSHEETAALALKAGVDMFTDDPVEVEKAVRGAFEKGLIEAEDIDRALYNKFRVLFNSGVMDENRPYTEYSYKDVETDNSRKTARNLQSAGTVLLKNNGILPLGDLEVKESKKADFSNKDEDDFKEIKLNGNNNSNNSNDSYKSNNNNKRSLHNIGLIGPLADEYVVDWYSGLSKKHVTMADGFRAVAEKPYIYDMLPVVKIKVRINDNNNDLLSSRDITETKDMANAKNMETSAFVAHNEDGEIIYTDDENAATFKIMLWDDEKVTFKSTANGKYLTMKAPNVKTLNTEEDDEINVGSDKPFGWFVKEVFYLADDEGQVISFNDKDAGTFWKDKRLVSLLDWKKEKVWDICLVEEEDILYDEVPDIVVAACGTHPMINCKEEYDRKNINMPPFERNILKKLKEMGKNVVLVLLTGYPVAIDWENEALDGILWSSSGSCELGNGIWDVLLGKSCASGRLNMTWYREEAHLPDIMDYKIAGTHRTYMNPDKVWDEENILFPFGFGLSYSTFEISETLVETAGLGCRAYGKCFMEESMLELFLNDNDSDNTFKNYVRDFNKNECNSYFEFGNEKYLKVSFTVKNVGDIISDRVVMAYATYKDKSGGDRKKLIGFRKIKDIKPGESKNTYILCDTDDLREYDEELGKTACVKEFSVEVS